VSETNDSGNRWEKPVDAEADDSTSTSTGEAASGAAEPIEVPADAVEAADPADPAAAQRSSRLPSWVTPRGLAATGAAAAIFVGGGGLGYAVGASGHHDDARQFPGRFDGQRPGGQFPGGQVPGGQGQIFGQGQQTQPQSDDGSSSGSDSGTSS